MVRLKKYKNIIIIFVFIFLIFQPKVHAVDWYKFYKESYNNNKELNYTNVNLWHKNGYSGKGVRIAIIDELIDPTLDFFDGKVKNVFEPNNIKNLINTHGQQVAEVAHIVAPDADIFLLDSSKTLEENLNWCIENNINIVNLSRSLYTYSKKRGETISKKAYDNGILLVKSVGNNGEEDGKKDELAKSNIWISVGSVGLNTKHKPVRSSYSSYGEGLDVMGFGNLFGTGVYPPDKNSSERFYVSSSIGTSISSPFVVGMIALYFQFYNEVFHTYPSHTTTKNFIIDNCEKLSNKHWDCYNGYGVFILPNINLLKQGYYFVNKVIYTNSKEDRTEWLEGGRYGNLKFDYSKDDNIIYDNTHSGYYIRVAKGYMYPLKNRGFSVESIKEKEKISDKTKKLIN